MEAAEIAANRGNGKRPAAGQKVKQGLFLNGINMFRHQPAIDQAVQNPALILPHPADATMPILDPAVMGTKFTVDLTFLARTVQLRLMHL
jgi:hypothetical protein